MKFKYYFIGLFLAVSAGLALRAFWYEPAHFVVNETRLSLTRWPSECEGFRIVVLADLHVGSPFNNLDNLRRVVDATNTIQPDLILLAGDYVIHEVMGGSFVAPEPIAKELKKLSAKLGVYAVLGNHDWWHSARQITRAFNKEGIALLENKALKLQKGACEFWLAGIGDHWGSHYDIGKALQYIPNQEAVIAFTHNPDIYDELPESLAITFAGHTHGGQVNLPILGRMIVPSRYGQRFALGHIAENDKHMFVTGGIGTSILPVRFNVPPEISLVTVSAE